MIVANPRSHVPNEAGFDVSAFAPDIVVFHRYWDSKRRGRRMPSRADIDPAEIVPLLPGITLIDVVADARGFVYRLVGTREGAIRPASRSAKASTALRPKHRWQAIGMSSCAARRAWSAANSPRLMAATD